MKILYDYLPIIAFFVAYKFYGIFVATAVTMAASFLQIAIYWLIYRRFEKLHLIMFVAILILGGLTLGFHNVIFIKWKPSVIYWLFGILLIGSHFIGEKPIIERLLGDKLKIPRKIWHRVNFSWGIFFLLLGCLNVYVLYHYNTSQWVNFKVFGATGLTLLFAIIQVVFLARHIKEEEK
ncbi:MAG: septation protein A [Coxiellaceae bacterium]|nr:septation protein A [Coxiellaceae bacterium]